MTDCLTSAFESGIAKNILSKKQDFQNYKIKKQFARKVSSEIVFRLYTLNIITFSKIIALVNL